MLKLGLHLCDFARCLLHVLQLQLHALLSSSSRLKSGCVQVSKALKAFAKLGTDERQASVQQHQADITGIVATMSTTVQV